MICIIVSAVMIVLIILLGILVKFKTIIRAKTKLDIFG
jgi:hypothetical protein